MTVRETQADTSPAAARAGIQNWFTPGRFAAILGTLIAVTFPDVVTGARTFFYRDFGVFTYPVAHYYRECFWRGELPLWNPLNNCGIPLLAQWNTAILYPPSLFYLVFPLSWSLGVFNLGHLFFGGLGMYLLARRWTGNQFAAALAGLAFGFNGLTWHMLMWVSNLAAWAWMPWVVLAVERAWRRGGRASAHCPDSSPSPQTKEGERVGERGLSFSKHAQEQAKERLLSPSLSSISWKRGGSAWMHAHDGRAIGVAALAGAMQMLSGAPEIIVFTWGLLGVLWAWQWLRKEAPRGWMLGRALAVGALVAGLSAAQLLPFLDLLGHSTRDPNFSDSGWSMPLSGAANFLVPLFRAQANGGQGVFVQYDQYWTSSVYLGVAIVALALLAAWRVREPRVWILVGTAAFGLMMALGTHGFLYAGFKAVFPQLGFMRYPIKFITLTLFSLPLLAAYAVTWFMAGPRDSKRADRSIVAVALVVAGLLGAILWRAWAHPATWENFAATWQNGLGRLGYFALIIGLLVLLRRAIEPKKQLLWALALLALAWVDVFTHAPEINPTVGREIYQPGAIRAQLNLPAARFGEPRFMPTLAAIEKTRYLSLPTPMADVLYRRLALYDDCNLLDDLPKSDGFFSVELREVTLLLGVMANSEAGGADLKGMKDYLGIGYISAPVSASNNMPEWRLRPSAQPLITAGQQPVFADGTNAAAGMFSAEFDPRRVIYLPTMARPFITASNAVAAQILPRKLSAQKLEFEVETPATTMVSIAQAYYHPWHAYVDGRETQLWYANFAFQALQVPAGHHQVSVVYEDQNFTRGLVVTAVSLLVCMGLWFRKTVEGKVEAYDKSITG